MSDVNTVQPPAVRRFPWLRVLYAIGYAVLAWTVLWIVIFVLAPLHFITLAITGRANPELQEFNAKAVHYTRDLLLFVTGVSDDKPFPLGPFPKT